MKQNYSIPTGTPEAHLAINKSRIKLYKTAGTLPTYYLQKGQEFSIELYNPTRDVILAKISLNGNPISQGGLVLNPGQRVFLDRYLDVAKKFLFSTYEVSNSAEVRQAIAENGDFKVEFFREYTPTYVAPSHITWNTWTTQYPFNQPYYGTGNPILFGTLTNTSNVGSSSSFNSSTRRSLSDEFNCSASMDSLNMEKSSLSDESRYKGILRSSSLKKKSIETGRVDQGSASNQQMKTVNKNWESFSFHTIEYKMLPVSQKINTAEDLNVKRYCVSCGAKLGKTDKFCSSCGHRA